MPRMRAKAMRGGFTLVEVVAALAIASVILVGTAYLIHDVALSFDRGTRRVGVGERLLLAADRLAADFGAARFVLRKNPAGVTAVFTGNAAKVGFVTGGGVGGMPQGEELVTLTVEQDGELARLVRRRAGWLEPRARFEDQSPQDPVVLIDGRVDMAFAYARPGSDGALSWSDSWTGEFGLPRYVRLTLRDRASGADLLAGSEFLVRADAPAACAFVPSTALPGNGTPAARQGPASGADPFSSPAGAPSAPAAGTGCLTIAPTPSRSSDSPRRSG